MNKRIQKKRFLMRCDKECKVHKLVTHNTCLFCYALKHSPYHPEAKNMSIEEIKKLQEEILREIEK